MLAGGLYIQIWQKTANGLPATTIIDELVPESLSFTHAAFGGALEASARIACDVGTAYTYASQCLGNMVRYYDGDGRRLWEGLITGVTIRAGGNVTTRSLEGYANTINIFYNKIDASTNPPKDYGKATASTSDSAGIAVYGTIVANLDGGNISATDASAMATGELARRSALLWLPDSGSAGEGVEVELRCAGWWITMTYRGYTSTTAGTQEIATTLGTIYAARWDFGSGTTDFLATTGVTGPRQFDQAETPWGLTKRLVALATGYTFRVDPGRVPVLVADQRSATTPHYYRRSDGSILDAAGCDVAPWLARPDTVLRRMDFFSGSGATAADAQRIESIYLTQTTYDSDSGLSWQATVAGPLGEVEAW